MTGATTDVATTGRQTERPAVAPSYNEHASRPALTPVVYAGPVLDVASRVGRGAPSSR